MGSAALKEFNAEIMQPCGEVDRTGPFLHAVHAVVGGQGLTVDPNFRSVIRVDEEGPVACMGHIDQSAETRTPMLLEPVVKAGVGVVGGPSVQLRLDLDTIGMPVDERGHAGGTETHAIVVKVLAVDALHPFSTVLVAIGAKAGLKRAVSTLLGVGLVGPCEIVLGGNRR